MSIYLCGSLLSFSQMLSIRPGKEGHYSSCSYISTYFCLGQLCLTKHISKSQKKSLGFHFSNIVIFAVSPSNPNRENLITPSSFFPRKLLSSCCKRNPIKWTIVRRGYLSPPLFQIIPPLKISSISPFPILFFQTLNVVMLIALAKSWSARGASHQPTVMVSCLS